MLAKVYYFLFLYLLGKRDTYTSSKRIAYLRKATAQSAACKLDLTCDSLHVFKKKETYKWSKRIFHLKKEQHYLLHAFILDLRCESLF